MFLGTASAIVGLGKKNNSDKENVISYMFVNGMKQWLENDKPKQLLENISNMMKATILLACQKWLHVNSQAVKRIGVAK